MAKTKQYSDRIVERAVVKLLSDESLTHSERVNCLWYLVEKYRIAEEYGKRYWIRHLLLNLDRVPDISEVDKLLKKKFVHYTDWFKGNSAEEE